jgi:hypothetical protein
LLSRAPTLFAPTLTRQASQSATFPRITRTPTLLSPTLTRQASGAITLPALIRNPQLFGFSISNIGLPRSLTFPLIKRVPRPLPMDFTPQVTITQLRDPNPFPPNVPESIRRLSPELWDYLEYQARTLRDQANKLQSGANAWPIEYLTLVSSTPAYPLGSKGRFQHPVFGLIRAVYCQFADMLALAGAPVGFVLGGSWVVTNDFSWSSGERAVGVLPGNAPADLTYGWVITEGSNLLILSLSIGVPQVGQELMWSGSGTVSASAAGVVIGRIVGSTLAPGSVLVGVSSANGSSIGAGFAQEISSLTAEVEDARSEILTIQTALSSGFYAEGTVVDSIETQLGVVVANLTTVTQAFVTGDTALANQIAGLRANLTSTINAEISRATSAEAALNESSAAAVDQLRVQFGSVSASTATALNQISVLTTDQYSLAQSVLNLSGQVDDPSTGLSATAEALVILTTEVGVIDGELTAITTRTTALEATVDDATTGVAATLARLVIEESTRADEDASLTSRVVTLESTVTGGGTGTVDSFARGEIIDEAATRASADTANADRSTALEATVNTGANANATLRTDLTTAATATTAVATRTTALEATVNTGANANASLRTDLTTAAGVGTANASAITVLQATVNTGGNANATLRTDLTANVTATTAVATRATALEATVNTGGNANATLRTDLTTAAGIGTANATAITTLQATVNTGPDSNATLRANLTTADNARISGDGALATRATNLEATVNTGANANATIRTDLTAAAGVGTANATAITSLTTTVGGHTSTLTTYGTSIGGLQAKAGVRLDVNGRVTGWELNNGGDSDDFIVISSNFKVLDPTLGDVPVFQVIGGYVYGNFRMRTAEIPDFISDVDARIAAAPPPTAIVTTGTSGTITFSLENGTGRSFEGVLNATVTGASGTVTTQLKVQIGSGSLSNFGTPGSESGGTFDPISAVATGTVSNTSGVTQIYHVTLATTIFGAASVAATSYLRG